MATALIITDDRAERRHLRTAVVAELADAPRVPALDVASAGVASTEAMLVADHPALAEVAVVMVGLSPADHRCLAGLLAGLDAPVVVLGDADIDDARRRFPGADAYLSRSASPATLACLAQALVQATACDAALAELSDLAPVAG